MCVIIGDLKIWPYRVFNTLYKVDHYIYFVLLLNDIHYKHMAVTNKPHLQGRVVRKPNDRNPQDLLVLLHLKKSIHPMKVVNIGY